MINKLVYQNYRVLSEETARQIAQVIAKKPDPLLRFPAGETSSGTFAELIKMHRKGEINFSKCKEVGLDEWVQLGKKKAKNCYHFLKENLFDRSE